MPDTDSRHRRIRWQLALPEEILPSVLRAVLFDFDGLLVDTESAGYIAWHEVFAEHGQPFDLGVWLDRGRAAYDWEAELAQVLDASHDHETIHGRRRQRRDELCTACPGAVDTVRHARQLGLGVALVTNNARDWVWPRLVAAGLDPCDFDVTMTGGMGHAPKPDPALYLAALRQLDAPADLCLAFEDSPAGVSAARAAGIPVIAVPNDITRSLDFTDADQIAACLAPELLRSAVPKGD